LLRQQQRKSGAAPLRGLAQRCATPDGCYRSVPRRLVELEPAPVRAGNMLTSWRGGKPIVRKLAAAHELRSLTIVVRRGETPLQVGSAPALRSGSAARGTPFLSPGSVWRDSSGRMAAQGRRSAEPAALLNRICGSS